MSIMAAVTVFDDGAICPLVIVATGVPGLGADKSAPIAGCAAGAGSGIAIEGDGAPTAGCAAGEGSGFANGGACAAATGVWTCWKH